MDESVFQVTINGQVAILVVVVVVVNVVSQPVTIKGQMTLSFFALAIRTRSHTIYHQGLLLHL